MKSFRYLLPILLGILLFCIPASAQIGMRSFTTTVVANDVGIGNIGSGIAYHQITWNPIGTVSTCEARLQGSADNVTFSDIISNQPCTLAGQSAVMNVVVNYIKIEVTTLTGGGSITVHWNGFNTNPGGGGGGGGTGGQIINPLGPPYNVKLGHFIKDATITSGANTIACTTTNDCNFLTTGAVPPGSICYATNMTSDVSALTSSTILPLGTLTVVDAQDATCSGGNATGNSPSGGATFFWGPQSGAGLDAAWQATVATCGSTLQLPPGVIFTTIGQFNESNDGCLTANPLWSAYSVLGYGGQTSLIVPTPDFDVTTCTGGSASATCFGGADGAQFSHFGIFGGGAPTIGSLNGLVLFEMNAQLAAVRSNDLLLTSWGMQGAGSVGFYVDGVSAASITDDTSNAFGDINCYFFPGPFAQAIITLSHQVCGNSINTSTFFSSGVTVSSGGIYGNNYTGGDVADQVAFIGNGAESAFISQGDQFPYDGKGTGKAQLNCSGSGNCYLDGDLFNATTNSNINLIASGSGKVYIVNSKFTETGTTSTAVDVTNSSSTIVSLGGNTFSGTTAAVNGTGASGKYIPNDTDIIATGTTAYSSCTGSSDPTACANAGIIGAATGSSLTLTGNEKSAATFCGVLNTTACIFTGYGSTSGTATITWPAVAGTVTNPVVFSNTIEQTQNAVATTPADSFEAYNTTAATSGATVQYSPALHFKGAAWNTTSSATNSVDYRMILEPVSSASPYGALLYQSSINGAAFATVFNVDTLGDFSLSGNVNVNSGQVVVWNGDTGLSRDSGGVVDFGTGAGGSTAGSIKETNDTASGTVRANTGFNANGTAGITDAGLCSATFGSTLGLVTTCTAASDPRLKIFGAYSHGLDAIMQIEPIHFHWNKVGLKAVSLSSKYNPEQIGFSAKNIQQAIPEAVGYERHDGIDYLSLPEGDRPIVAALVNAVKEQQKEIDTLKREIAKLKDAR